MAANRKTLKELREDWKAKKDRYLDRNNGFSTGHKSAMTRAYNLMKVRYLRLNVDDYSGFKEFKNAE